MQVSLFNGSVNPYDVKNIEKPVLTTKAQEVFHEAVGQVRATVEGLSHRRFINFSKLTVADAEKLIAEFTEVKAKMHEAYPHASTAWFDAKIKDLQKWIDHKKSSPLTKTTESIIYHTYWSSIILKYFPSFGGPFIHVGDFKILSSITLAFGLITSTFTLIKESMSLHTYNQWLKQNKIKTELNLKDKASILKMNEMIRRLRSDDPKGPTYESFCSKIRHLFDGQQLKSEEFVISELKRHGLYEEVCRLVAARTAKTAEQVNEEFETPGSGIYKELIPVLKEQTAPAQQTSILHGVYVGFMTKNFQSLCETIITKKHTIGQMFMRLRVSSASFLFPLSVASTTLIALANLGMIAAVFGVAAAYTVTGVGIILAIVTFALIYYYRKETIKTYASTTYIKLTLYDLEALYYRLRKRMSSSADSTRIDHCLKEIKAKSDEIQTKLNKMGARDFQHSIGVDEDCDLGQLLAEGFNKYEKHLSQKALCSLRKGMGFNPEEFLAFEEDAMITFIQSAIDRETIDVQEMPKSGT